MSGIYKSCGHPKCREEVTRRTKWCIYHRGWHDALDMVRAVLNDLEEQPRIGERSE